MPYTERAGETVFLLHPQRTWIIWQQILIDVPGTGFRSLQVSADLSGV